MFARRFNGPVNPPEHSDKVYHCGGGINSYAIDPQGKMSICVLSHFDTYDLRGGSFREGWEHFLLQVRRKKASIVTKCVACQIKAVCGMCAANGELENGHPEKPVDFLCQVAHLRAQVLGFPAPPHGDCEYCEGGTGYEALMRSVAYLQEGSSWKQTASSGSSAPLPILTESSIATESGCSPGGCAACSMAAP